ncbi:MAG: hypothetical protein JNJ54_11690 [Myxococcaceae bacterium]|nr:hypothetical protein [Myxococcaceae bacterium]
MPRAFLETSHCVFATAPGLGREQALLAAARLHVRPALLTAPLPCCLLVTNEVTEARALLDDAKAVGVDAWVVAGADVRATDQATRVTLGEGVVDFTTATRVRRVTFARLAAYVDLRWKLPSAEARVVVLVPDDARPLLVKPEALEVDGPSRQGALLKLLTDLQQAALARAREATLVHVGQPQQVNVPPEVPAGVVALALAEGLRRRPSRR